MRGTIQVHRSLTERNVPHEFYRLERPLRNIDEAAAVLGLAPSNVIAAELFETESTPVLALVPADACASVSDVARSAGVGRVRPATSSRVAAHTGFLPRWLPPVGHERPSLVLVESSLLESDAVYAAGGDPGVMLVLRATDLARATAATVALIAAMQPGDAAATPA